jgi:hypothetical protein
MKNNSKLKKMLKQKKKPGKGGKIEKKPLSPKEREDKLRKDRIKIAKRYEEMRLFDEAIKYYKKLGLSDDVKRVSKIKKDIYVKKAAEYESQEKYKDAARLYENLKMKEDLDRVKKIIGEDEIIEESAEDGSAKEGEMDIEIEPEAADQQVSLELDDDEDNFEIISEPDSHTKQTEEVSMESIKTTGVKGPKKVFKICPFCGEELNLPKKPNFCPYCEESFV